MYAALAGVDIATIKSAGFKYTVADGDLGQLARSDQIVGYDQIVGNCVSHNQIMGLLALLYCFGAKPAALEDFEWQLREHMTRIITGLGYVPNQPQTGLIVPSQTKASVVWSADGDSTGPVSQKVRMLDVLSNKVLTKWLNLPRVKLPRELLDMATVSEVADVGGKSKMEIRWHYNGKDSVAELKGGTTKHSLVPFQTTRKYSQEVGILFPFLRGHGKSGEFFRTGIVLEESET